MKKILILFSVMYMTFNVQCSNSNASDEFSEDKKQPQIAFKEKTHDYGTIEWDGDGLHEFEFENTGEQPLILNNVSSSCGCTVPKWPREPINAGEKGTIKVVYNTKRTGTFSKSVTVYSNAQNSPVVLKIKGKVAPRKQAK